MLNNKLNLKNSKQLLIVVASFIAALVTIYVAYTAVANRNFSLSNPANRPGAANPSCLLNLALYHPTPSPSPTPTAPPKVTPTPTSSPSSSPCSNCQYQVDLFYGPVIQSFAGGVRYSNTTPSRLIASRSDYATFPGCNLNTVSPITAPTVTLPTGCANPITNGYLAPANGTTYFDTTSIKSPAGYVYATIKNTTTTCTYNIGLATYKANGTNIDIQNLNDYSSVNLGPGQTIKLAVKAPMLNDLPSCHTPASPAPTPTSTPVASACTNWGVDEHSVAATSKIIKINSTLTTASLAKSYDCATTGFCEIESMDYDTNRSTLFVVPNNVPTPAGKPKEALEGLYAVNTNPNDSVADGTMTLYKAFAAGSAFQVNGLSFKKSDPSKAWLWRNGTDVTKSGLYTMDLTTGVTKLEYGSINSVESIDWDSQSRYLYISSSSKPSYKPPYIMWKYDPLATGSKITQLSNTMPGISHSMDFAPSNYLNGMLVAFNESPGSNFYTYDVVNKVVVKNYPTLTYTYAGSVANIDAFAACIPN